VISTSLHRKNRGNKQKMHIKPGSLVKILRNGESFWVKVTSVKGDTVSGTVDNKLVKNTKIGLGSKITFKVSKVLEIKA